VSGGPSEAGILPLRFEGVRFAVGERALLDGVDFELSGPGRTVILGANGAGKSLTLRLAHGLLDPSAGRIVWAGAGPGARVRERQAMVFEQPVMLRRSARANVEYALSLRGVGRGERRARADRMLERTGLGPLATRSARVLSGGERQRLALARAWALAPEILFLDEPTAALDPTATRAVERLIEEISADGCKIVMTSHDLAQARRLADEVLFFHRGRLVEQAPAERFFAGPDHPAAAAFLRGDLAWED